MRRAWVALLLLSGCGQDGQPAIADIPVMPQPDTAKVTFSFTPNRASGLSYRDAAVTYDDGSGAQTVSIDVRTPRLVTRNSGRLQVRFVVGAPDTLAVGDLNLELRKDYIWLVGAHVTNRNPLLDSFCGYVKTFPLRRPNPGADSLYIRWLGFQYSTIDQVVLC